MSKELNDVIMPSRLTAENGAKGALLGEFTERIKYECSLCNDGEDDFGDTCDNCDGLGLTYFDIPVSWTNIKEIYKEAVDLLALQHDTGWVSVDTPPEKQTLCAVKYKTGNKKIAYYMAWWTGEKWSFIGLPKESGRIVLSDRVIGYIQLPTEND